MKVPSTDGMCSFEILYPNLVRSNCTFAWRVITLPFCLAFVILVTLQCSWPWDVARYEYLNENRSNTNLISGVMQFILAVLLMLTHSLTTRDDAGPSCIIHDLFPRASHDLGRLPGQIRLLAIPCVQSSLFVELLFFLCCCFLSRLVLVSCISLRLILR